MNQLLLKLLVLSGFFLGCASRSSVYQAASAQEVAIAFPGAEGFGKYTTGGRGGKVLIVSNLDDNGPGSLRDALAQKGKKIVVFGVSGTIHLESPLSIKGDVTIAGQSAPGDGICLADYPVLVSGDNVIIRYMRFRMGDRYQGQKGMVNGSGGDDALSASRRKHIIIDHCSISWGTDEAFSVYGGDSTTLQWNLIAEPLNYSYHFETGDKDWEHHGYGGIWGGVHLSAHHNLFAHCVSRTPRFNGTRLGASQEFADFRNNVIYNWQSNNVYGGEGGRYNVVANYYKPGPATSAKVSARIVNPSRNEEVGFGKFYVSGNFVEGAPNETKDNVLGIHIGRDNGRSGGDSIIMKNAFAAEPISVQEAKSAFNEVLKYAGSSLQRDTLDARLIADVKTGKGRIIDVQGGYPHGTPYEQSKNAWPALKSAAPLPDTDRDGMPDAWEDKNGLNKSDERDAAAYKSSKVYTNIEIYLNGLVERK